MMNGSLKKPRKLWVVWYTLNLSTWLNCDFPAIQGYIFKRLSHLPRKEIEEFMESGDVLIVWENF